MDIRISQQYIPNANCVVQFGYFEDKNFPTRQNMQDNYIAIDSYMDNPKYGLFCILDGHGGNQVSQFCAQTLPNIIQAEYDKIMKNSKKIPNLNQIRTIFENAFIQCDNQLKLVGASETGTTCCMICYVANLGDTRAILLREGSVQRITTDHKVTNNNEQERIKKQGGVIIKGRVAGQLAITRALGDLELKSQGVSNRPDIERIEYKQKDRIIIASDGLWDIVDDEGINQIIQGVTHSGEIAKVLVQYALKNGTKDNVSVIAIQF